MALRASRQPPELLNEPPTFSHVGLAVDVGCGIRPQKLVSADTKLAIEPHDEYCDIVRTQHVDWIVLQDTWHAICDFPDKMIDVLTALDMIEHLPRGEGEAFLEEVQRVAKAVVIFTPDGRFPQEMKRHPDQWGLSGGAWQRHRSHWTPKDFPGWQIHRFPKFHVMDAFGRPLPKPIGAFYAVKR